MNLLFCEQKNNLKTKNFLKKFFLAFKKAFKYFSLVCKPYH
ncbi:hypothetical protein ACINIS235_A0152 [Acinetobacter baumannii IS-235]|nr:hypothetical protein ACINIS58_A0096 [Acinetobacter baumannii IS-58]EKK06241.1 hypothetical protein ACINIS235_A0152 [Acinetobacter baumannii IS-235]